MTTDSDQPDVDPLLEEMVSGLQQMVAGGGSIEGWKAQQRWTPPDIVNEVIRIYKSRVGVVVWPDDEVILETPGKPWYITLDNHVLWPRVRDRLSLGEDDLNEVDRTSTKIVNLLPPPGQPRIRTRGLVLGYVQSGKTTSFISVMAKAADSGYRFFVVLSGTTDSLRKQTQQRIDALMIEGGHEWFQLTTADEDFTTRHNAANLLNGASPKIAVVKKNPARLRRLKRWLGQASKQTLETVPILIVDDEADQASINVAAAGRTSAINRLIREILAQPKSAYLAYTATPFANLLIDPTVPDDLYPKDFIYDLPRPNTYLGPERIFGRRPMSEEEADDPAIQGMPVLRDVPDEDAEMVRPPRGRAAAGRWVPGVPQTLEEALRWFVLGAAVRRLRHGDEPHASMLVHTTMLAAAQVSVADAIRDVLAGWSHDPRQQEDAFRRTWERETGQVPPVEDERFDVVWAKARGMLSAVEVVVDNYLIASADRLNFEEGTKTVVAVGGNTLARGLTLAGLLCSYFVRSANAYDTLLQMGRWFGYRPGYEDLIRIWTPTGTQEWFCDLALVEEEIREEIRQLAADGATPAQVPIKIRAHPALAITRASAMRAAVPARVSYSGVKVETTWFDHLDRKVTDKNLTAVKGLVAEAFHSGVHETVFQGQGRRGFDGLDVELIVTFLRSYEIHPQNAAAGSGRNMQRSALIKYIRNENSVGALLKWNVAFIEKRGAPEYLDVGLSSGLRMLERSRFADPSDVAQLNSLTSTPDRGADMPSRPGLGRGASDAAWRSEREGIVPDRGLLLLYPIDKDSGPAGKGGRRPRTALGAVGDLIGVALCFPPARGLHNEVDYVVAPLPESEVEDYQQEEADGLEALDRSDEEVAL